MKQYIIKIRIFFYILRYNCLSFILGKSPFSGLLFTLRKQFLIASKLNDAKYISVGNKFFSNPFMPYFPGSFFNKMLENNSVDRYPLKPNYAQISITNQCLCCCDHCHVQNTQIKENDLSLEILKNTIDDIIDKEFFIVFFVGGEPLMRFDDLAEMVRYSSKRLDTRIFTSGIGATCEKLAALREAGLNGICVSLDHYDASVHNKRRHNDKAYESAIFTIKESVKLGFYVSVVSCTTSDMVITKEIYKVVDFAESLGAHSIQINEIRPVGNAIKTNDTNFYLTESNKKELIDYYKKQNRSGRKISIVMPWYNEESYNFGCMATAGQNVYIDSEGFVTPCVLLKAGIGNVKNERFSVIWDSFTRMCRFPVRECIVHHFRNHIEKSKIVPLPKEMTYKIWPSLFEIGESDMYKKIKMKESGRE